MPFSQPRENLEVEQHQPHDHNSPPLTSVCPFHVLRFDFLYNTLSLMFRIFVATGRSVQQRSTTTLHYLRPFQSTISIPRSSSTTTKPIEYQTETQLSSVGTVHSDSLPSLETKGTAPAATEASDSKTKPKRPRRAKPTKENDDPAEDASSKTIKRGGRPRKKPEVKDDTAEPASGKPVKTRKPRGKKAQNPEDGEGKAASNTKRQPPKSSKKSKVEQSEDSSASPGSSIVVEERIRKASFTSQDIRADVLPYLQWTRGGVSVGKAIGDKKRLNIVSKSLCDDVIERLGPSLRKHIGCDIIDVNPGAAVWSEKLHNFLKPRTHILLEPDHAYQPLLQPLLDAPGSKYKLVPKSGIVWGHLEKVLCKEYLPHQEAFERGDRRLEERNDSLLFVANLGFHPKRPYRGFPSIANLVLYQFMSAIRSHSLFQRYGLVRMLIWIENEERNTVLPRTISLRRKSAIEAEIACEKIQEIASSTEEVGVFRRQNDLELERTRLVYEKMKEMGIGVPKDRESTLLTQLREGKPHEESKRVLTVPFLEELEGLERKFAAGEFKEEIEINQHSQEQSLPQTVEGWEEARISQPPLQQMSEAQEITQSSAQQRTPYVFGRPAKYYTPEFSRMKSLQRLQTAKARRYDKLGQLRSDLDNIYSVQREVLGIDESERHALEEELKQRTYAWIEAFNELSFGEQETLSIMVDNDRAVLTNPPTLLWDRREFEPLKVRSAEFFPHRKMCLLDIQPKSLWPVLRENFPENYDVFEYIVGQLLILPTQTIKRGLSALAPGAYDYLIAECPSLTDPAKGGSSDFELMTVRRLTQDMLKEIVEAWVRWPYKPTRFEVMSKMGSMTFDPDALAIDGSDD